jgi:hypothetical protein
MEIPRKRPVDQKRIKSLYDRTGQELKSSDIWFSHTVLTQCFLPYRDPKSDTWERKNGDFSITLVAGHVRDPRSNTLTRRVGLPYGAKPRLFQSYVCMQAVKTKSPVIPMEDTMTEFMHLLGLQSTGGKYGTIRGFKEQVTKFAAAHFSIIGPGAKGVYSHIKTTPIQRFDVFFPTDARQGSLWPSELQLTADFYESLKDHAIPFDFRALLPIKAKPRAIDIYLWLSQRLCRIDERKPLLLKWKTLYEMFGADQVYRNFKVNFPKDMVTARVSYSAARVEQCKEGFIFRYSAPPVPRTLVAVK